MAGDEHFLPVSSQILDTLIMDPSWDFARFPAPPRTGDDVASSRTGSRVQSSPVYCRAGGDGPFLQILEQPKQRGFRFRYGCEGPSHGGLPGASSEKNKKTYPAVRICNYQGPARVVVQLVTALTPVPQLHAHSLVGKQCDKGVCIVDVAPKDADVAFPNLGIQHVTKKNVAKTLEERMAEAVRMGYNFGAAVHPDLDRPRGETRVPRQLTEHQRGVISSAACAQAKEMDLSVVRLMFTAFLPDSDGGFTRRLQPVVSQPIYDSKAPNASNLKIVRMDRTAGCVSGGEEVYLLCDKVQKDDIQVRFFEEDDSGPTWEALGDFSPTDVHRQFAIVFKTPKYRDQNLQKPTSVFVQLKRKSDNETSEPKPFTYHPQIIDKEEVQRKRQKTLPNFQDFSGHGGGGGGSLYRGGPPAPPGAGGGPGSAGGGYFQGFSTFNYGRGMGDGPCPSGYSTGLGEGGVKREGSPGDSADDDPDDDTAACAALRPELSCEDDDALTGGDASAVLLYAATGDAAYLLALRRPLIAAQDEDGDTGLHLAVLHRQQGALASLTRVLAALPGDGLADARNHLYQTPLHLAVITWQTAAASALLAAGADPTLTDRHGNTPLHLAAQQGGAMVRLLLHHREVRGSVDACNTAGMCAIHLSVVAKQLPSLRELLEGGADVEAQERGGGRTALHLATEADNVSLAGCLLLEGNAKVDCCTFNGSTPLHIAAGRGSVKLTALLMAAGADPHKENLEPLFFKEEDEEEDEGYVPGTSPINMAASEQVLELLSGKEYRPKCLSVALSPQGEFAEGPRRFRGGRTRVMCFFLGAGDMSSLGAQVKTALCRALASEACWEKLAHALGLGILNATFRLSPDPVKTLVESYEVSGGTGRNLLAALRSVGSSRALSVLEEALSRHDDKHNRTTGGDGVVCPQMADLEADAGRADECLDSGACDSGVEFSAT
ncbi:nuclear factor NF-kappa-B p105 subunit isoform X2 [Phycodurus eques]|nr:nuclear factor NF-kappa-B p105 subunit isoform X2 [Phycodurus eques]XP_061542454.1 nuclear factor NF-kappa-B p105 subunit isoform X2 [Phycodurus eques]XP_061542455.1 nuclear factor NF-kappa-B p105 subunit isoform X2 [Phycodurus eques]XP_061542456.1 nuclear factor NF-kappa-B p105 subunit isoform X2 [Phycodurus eques]XP_061542457.1 nuclear factor NF-kappa-B p105 subunit isoform X2 [Phycodurus eques]